MDFYNVITDAVKILKNNSLSIDCYEYGNADINFEAKKKIAENKGFFIRSDELEKIYKERTFVDLQWQGKINENNAYGGIKLLPIEQAIKKHEMFIEMYYDSLNYIDDSDRKKAKEVIKSLENMYPIIELDSADAFCIDTTTDNIVYFDHSVFEYYDSDINGLIISESIESLFEKWSKILFLNNFWWKQRNSRGLKDNEIDLSNTMFTDIIAMCNNSNY